MILTTHISTHADTHARKTEQPPAGGEREGRGEGALAKAPPHAPLLVMAKMRCHKGWGAKLGHAGMTAAARGNGPVEKNQEVLSWLWAINI